MTCTLAPRRRKSRSGTYPKFRRLDPQELYERYGIVAHGIHQLDELAFLESEVGGHDRLDPVEMSQNDIRGVAVNRILEAGDEVGQECVVFDQLGHDRGQVWMSPEHPREERTVFGDMVRGQRGAESGAEEPELRGERRRGSAALDRQPEFYNLAAENIMHEPKFLTPCYESIAVHRVVGMVSMSEPLPTASPCLTQPVSGTRR